MIDSVKAVDESVQLLDRLRAALRRRSTSQVASIDERSLVKATAHTWFHSIRPRLATYHSTGALPKTDQLFSQLLDLADHHTTRAKYFSLLHSLKQTLAELRGEIIAAAASLAQETKGANAPDFKTLIHDPRMESILVRRWEETQGCLKVGAHLAATVMMGALLEALFLARVNALSDKGPVFKAAATPRDHRTHNPLPLKEWALKDYIDVASELGWIRQSAKDIGAVLRDYRNYVHPYKEFTHGVALAAEDTTIFWTVFTSLAEQVLKVR
jgi:hypothetical protein